MPYITLTPRLFAHLPDSKLDRFPRGLVARSYEALSQESGPLASPRRGPASCACAHPSHLFPSRTAYNKPGAG